VICFHDATLYLSSNAAIASFSAYHCLQDMEGGQWALLRRVAAGSSWHPAVDDLRGWHSYGSYGLGTFSANFLFMINPDAELLFTTGMWRCDCCLYLSSLIGACERTSRDKVNVVDLIHFVFFLA
jgi:hypothetical protein